MLSKIFVSRKSLIQENENLKKQIEKVWIDAFNLGFSKAWDMTGQVQMDGILRARKMIEDQAINRTISGGV